MTNGVATYAVVPANPNLPTLCPGEKTAINVSVNQSYRRISGVYAPSQPVAHGQIFGQVNDATIGLLTPTVTNSAWVGGAGGGFYATFIFTANNVGSTTIDFTGQWWPDLALGRNAIAATPAPPVMVRVACDYRISIYSTWSLPGERTLDMMGVVQSAKATLDQTGKFSTTATMSSSAAWIGSCPGGSRIQHSKVQIDGELTPGQSQVSLSPLGGTPASARTRQRAAPTAQSPRPQRLKIKVTYAPVSSTTHEGCLGKATSDQGRAENLDFDVSPSGGVMTTRAHVLRTYVMAPGTTTVIVTQVRP